VFAIGIASRSKAPVREAVSHKDDHKQTYICGFLMLMNKASCTSAIGVRRLNPARAAALPEMATPTLRT